MGSSSKLDDSKDDLKKTVEKINRLWVGGNADKLGRYFHRDMIIVRPDLKKKPVTHRLRWDCRNIERIFSNAETKTF